MDIIYTSPDNSNHPLHIQKVRLTKFWKDVRGTDSIEKLRLLREISEYKVIYWDQQPLYIRRGKFKHLKYGPRGLFRLWRSKCFVCRVRAQARHHLIQLQNGGINSKSNLVHLCNPCHAQIHPWLLSENVEYITLPDKDIPLETLSCDDCGKIISIEFIDSKADARCFDCFDKQARKISHPTLPESLRKNLEDKN